MGKGLRAGKFILDSLTVGMYSDPKVIFREYIQNSSDAIDAAVKAGVLKNRDEAKIDIHIDRAKKCIRLFDNGTGVSAEKAWNILCDIGNSEKDYRENRGFRGIGRLGGLSYAEELRFITSAKGESKKTEIFWDCKRLRELLQPGKHDDYDLLGVVMEVAKINFSPEDSDTHYFKVVLNGIDSNHGELLEPTEVREYLSQVAPVPFNAQYFSYSHDSKTGIHAYAKKLQRPIEEYPIFLNGDPNPIYKPYKNDFKSGKGENTERDSVSEVRFFEEREKDRLLFWGWYSISDFKGYIKDSNIAGFRVRKHNIQIGDGNIIESFFSQERFNKYFLGEIYVFDEDLIPNARRDSFEKNHAFNLFKTRVEKITRESLSKLPYIFSELNSTVRKLEQEKEELATIQETVKGGVSSEHERNELFKKRDQIIQNSPNLQKKLESCKKKIEDLKEVTPDDIDKKIKDASELAEKAKKIENAIIDADFAVPKEKLLAHHSREVKNAIMKVFEIIDKTLEPALAKGLQEKIIAAFKKEPKKKK